MKGSQRERLDFPFLLDDKHIFVITDIGYLRMDTPVMHSNQIPSPAIIIISFLLPFLRENDRWWWTCIILYSWLSHFQFIFY